VIPVLWTLTGYALTRAYASRRSAFAAALVFAIGFQFMLEQFERDFYMAYLMLGAALLILRAGFEFPLLQMSPRRLALTAFAAGFATYTCRASLIFVIAAFLPPVWAAHEAREVFLKPLARASLRWIRRASCAFIALFVYVELFGRSLGAAAGHAIKLDAAPNLKIAFLLALLLAWGRRGWRLPAGAATRIALAGATFLLGLAPEIQYRLTHRIAPVPGSSGTVLSSFAQALQTLGEIPAAWATNVTAGNGILRVASILLSLIAFGVLARSARGAPRLRPVAFAGLLTILAFAAITQSPAPARYLIPLFPVLAVALAVWFDRLRSVPAICGTLLLLGLHAGSHVAARSQMIVENGPGRLQQALAMIETFRARGVKLVVTDDYWESNQYSFLSRCRPCFLSDGRPLAHPQAFELEKTERQAGILLTRASSVPSKDGLLRLKDATWQVQPLDFPGPHRLLIGIRRD
jgi:hypothetical protein